MKRLFLVACGFCFLFSANSLAQIDIYQSDAYSLEEMCARQAAQPDTEDYGTAYEACIEKNQDNPMYRPDAHNTENKLTEKNGSGEDAIESHL